MCEFNIVNVGHVNAGCVDVGCVNVECVNAGCTRPIVCNAEISLSNHTIHETDVHHLMLFELLAQLSDIPVSHIMLILGKEVCAISYYFQVPG